MKKHLHIIFILASASCAGLHGATLVNLSDLTLGAQSHHNNGSFTSNGFGFNNSYDSQNGSWGGFAYSNKTDTATAGYLNQFSAYPGKDADAVTGGNFAVGFWDSYTPTTPTITMPVGLDEPISLKITNTTYVYLSMRDGDGFGKKFGGDDGTDPDYFRWTITGYNAGHVQTGAVIVYLADFRFAVSAQDYIVNSWISVDLTPLGSGVKTLEFTPESSDAGLYGINTPTYFAIDNLSAIPEPRAWMFLALAGGVVAIWRTRRVRTS